MFALPREEPNMRRYGCRLAFAAIVATVCAANPVIACSDEKAQRIEQGGASG